MTENSEIPSEMNIVSLKLRLYWRALTTGITMRAEISRTPIMGIASDTVKAAKVMSKILIACVGRPLTFAASSSKVIYTNSL